MFNQYYKNILIIVFSLFVFINSKADIIKDIKIYGNERISNQTIILFSKAKLNDDINDNDLNIFLKSLYETNFFKEVSLEFTENILSIYVKEEPIIQSVIFRGIKASKFIDPIKKNIQLKDRSSYKEIIFFEDKRKIEQILRLMGYYFSEISSSIEDLGDNKINLIYDINLGDKAKISKINFTGNKIYKDKKLKSLIASEEYKFWKFISGRKFLNEDLLNVDKKLLKNFYLNNGYYDVEINSSFAKLISENEFELIFNINAKNKYYFNKFDLNISNDYSKENFNKIFKLFDKLKDKPYSINSIDNILETIDEIVIAEQFESIKATVTEKIVDNKIDLSFDVKETEKFFVERINIFGNNVTEEKVIRNQLLIDEGDPYNEILKTKSINNIKSLNFFRNVQSEVVEAENKNKVINITVDEKPTGEITAGAGVGTEGSTILFGIKENNFLGKGISLDSHLKLAEEDIKGNFTITNPNFRNSDKSIFFNVQALEVDKMSTSGYKTNKSGFKIGTEFEYYDDLNLGIANSNYYEKISTDSTASARQQKQKGNYWDSFISLNFILDKRNQKFQTSRGYLSRYDIDLPIISDTNSLINKFSYKYYTQLYNENVSSIGLTLGSSFSLDNDVKLSERLFIPSNKLRGFESGKVGPKDGNDFIGGNYLMTFNISSTLPQILPNSQDTDFSVFLDVAHLWGVDYDSSIDGEGPIRSSIGLGLDWFTVIGPVSFTYAYPISKDTKDITQEFSFNLGTTF
jgi:outer membrane protein insertion porin family